jgi:hypothetical protein
MIGHPRAETPQDTMTSSVIRIDPKQDTLSIPAPWKRINHPGPKPLNSHRTDTRSDADGEEPIAELNPTADVPTDVGPKLGDEAAQTARTNRQRLQNKLERIVLDQYPTRPTDADLPLSAVLEELAELSRQRDPDKLGVNFLISSHLDRPTLAMQQLLANQGNLGGPGFAPPIDPTTGLPAAAQGTPAVILLRDLRTEVTVRIRPALHNVRLKEVLDSIEMVAEAKSSPDFPGIKYSVSEYAVVFSQRTPEIDQLYNKTFKVDPNSFIEGMEKLLADKSETASSTGKLDNAPAGAAPGDRSTWVLPFVNHDAELHRSQPPTMDLSMSRGLGGGSGSAPYTGLGSTSVMRQTEIRTIQDYVRQFFSTATGIDFGGDLPRAVVGGNAVQNGGGAQSVGDPGAGPGRQFKYIRPMFFNDRTGVLFVRATMEELDLVEQAIQVLQIPPGHVVVRVDAVLLALNTGGPDGSFDQHFPILVKRPEVTLTSNGMSVPSSIDRFVGALPERQFQALEEAASHGDGFERLAAPTITMVSGGKGWLQLAMSELLVEVTPETVPNGHQVQLAIDLTLAAKARTGSEPDNQPSTPLSIRALVGDGETVILGKLTSAELGITPKLGGKEIVYALCITPRMVDPASKPGKKQDDQPDDPGIVPVQKAVRPQDEK